MITKMLTRLMRKVKELTEILYKDRQYKTINQR